MSNKQKPISLQDGKTESLKGQLPIASSEPTTDDRLPSTAQPEPSNLQPITEPETTNPKPQTEEMEVHHHAHHGHEKKTWKNYFWEFFMLFTAVFCGSIAELQLEHYIEHKREIKYIEAFVNDIKTDTAIMKGIIRADNNKEKSLDSLLILSKMDLKQPAISKLFIGYFIKGAPVPRLAPSNAAITQLKSSGSLRLITHKGALDSILKYDKFNGTMIEHTERYVHNNDLLWEASYAIIDARIFQDTTYSNFFARKLTDKQTPPLRLNQEKLDIFLGHATRESLFNKVSKGILETQLQRATRMLEFFEKEYHLEHE